MEDIDTALAGVDYNVLGSLVIMHCQALHLPRRLQYFRNLLFFEIYNSTIVDWPKSSALTATSHPRLAMVLLALINFENGDLPVGLISEDFPSSVTRLGFCAVRLDTWPNQLPVAWTNSLATLTLEWLDLKATQNVEKMLELPVSLSMVVSVADTNSQFPRALLDKRTVGDIVWIQGKHISSLPEDITNTSIPTVHVEKTNISTIPEWLISSPTTRSVFAHGTPFCKSFLPGQISNKIHCSPSRRDMTYPLDQRLREREP